MNQLTYQATADGAALLRDNPLLMGLPGGAPFLTKPLPPMRAAATSLLDEMRRTTAPVTMVAEADATNLIRLKQAMEAQFESQTGIALTYMPFFARAATKALQAWPIMNGQITPQGIQIPQSINLGLASQGPGVVLIPTIRHVERKDIPTLAREIQYWGQRARTGQVSYQDMADTTFVMTNVGKYAGTLFGTPTIKPPNIGILSFEAITKRPVVTEGDRIEARPMMYLALTADSRAVDGREMIGFLEKVAEAIENPTA